MSATLESPSYTVAVITEKNKYDLSPVVTSIEFSNNNKQFANRVTINLMNTLVEGSWMSSTLKVRQRIFIYADDGEKKDEVFRGYIWTINYKSSNSDRNLEIRCYDNLIFFQESDESTFFSAGKSTKDVIGSIFKKWGVNIEYTYQSITHSKLALRGNLSDIITSDILNLVYERTSKKYVILSEKDIVKIRVVGENKTVYQLLERNNAIYTKTEQTMEGMVTKVIITGKTDSEDRTPIEATVYGNTGQYGTLQQMISRDENTSLSDAKKEAQSIIDENGSPKWEYEIETADIPWIQKGDKVYVNAGGIKDKYLIVSGISRSISAKTSTMILTMEQEK